MVEGGSIQSEEDIFILIFDKFRHKADSSKERNQTKSQDTPIIIFGSWFDDSAAVVCVVVGSGVVGVVDEVDVSVIRSGGGPCLKIKSKQIWFTKFLVKYT